MVDPTDSHTLTKPGIESQRLLDSARKLREYAGKRRNVFISFHTDDESQVNLLRQQARDDRFDLEFRDYSIKEPFDEAWKSHVRDIISKTSAMIVMIGPHTAYRKSVDWEIREAYRQGKAVIGVRIYRNQRHAIPTAMIERSARIVSWNMREIKGALETSTKRFYLNSTSCSYR